MPHSLPLAEYAGTYRNRGYGALRLALVDTKDVFNPHGVIEAEKVLHADVDNKTWCHELDLEHINGEHFVSWLHRSDTDTWAFFNAFKAEFRIGSDGKVTRLGLQYEPAMGENKILV